MSTCPHCHAAVESTGEHARCILTFRSKACGFTGPRQPDGDRCDKTDVACRRIGNDGHFATGWICRRPRVRP